MTRCGPGDEPGYRSRTGSTVVRLHDPLPHEGCRDRRRTRGGRRRSSSGGGARLRTSTSRSTATLWMVSLSQFSVVGLPLTSKEGAVQVPGLVNRIPAQWASRVVGDVDQRVGVERVVGEDGLGASGSGVVVRVPLTFTGEASRGPIDHAGHVDQNGADRRPRDRCVELSENGQPELTGQDAVAVAGPCRPDTGSR